MKPELFDVFELLTDLPGAAIRAGALGTIVEEHRADEAFSQRAPAYEVEFANSEGETLELRALVSEQFIVVWKHVTQTWVPLADRVAAMIQTLPEERQEQALNFARSVYQTLA